MEDGCFGRELAANEAGRRRTRPASCGGSRGAAANGPSPARPAATFMAASPPFCHSWQDALERFARPHSATSTSGPVARTIRPPKIPRVRREGYAGRPARTTRRRQRAARASTRRLQNPRGFQPALSRREIQILARGAKGRVAPELAALRSSGRIRSESRSSEKVLGVSRAL